MVMADPSEYEKFITDPMETSSKTVISISSRANAEVSKPRAWKMVPSGMLAMLGATRDITCSILSGVSNVEKALIPRRRLTKLDWRASTHMMEAAAARIFLSLISGAAPR
jgi:hypothetical protein